MEELQEHTEAAENQEQPKKKTIWGRLLRFTLWIAGIWLFLLIVLQIVLSPSVLNRLVAKYAPEYIDGDLKFERIDIHMFRHFPNVGIVLDNGSLTYPAERFDSLEAGSVQGRLMYHGCGETADTLASFKHFAIEFNAVSLFTGKIRIKHIEMAKPRIFAHSYDGENANWNIFKFESEEDTTETDSKPLPHIAIGKIRFTDHPHIVYTDCADTLFAIIDVKSMSFDGRLDTKQSSKNRIGLSMDSMMVAGRMARDTIGLRMNRFQIHEHRGHMDIMAEAKTLLATRAFGRMFIPVMIEGTAAFPKDTVPTIVMNGFKGEIAAIPFDFDLTLKKISGEIDMDGRFSINNCKAEDIIDGFIKNIIPQTKDIKTDAALSMSGTCRGRFGNGRLPDVDMRLSVPETSVSHKDFEHEIDLGLEANLKTDSRQKFNLGISKAHLSTYGLSLNATADISDLLGQDPLISMDGNMRASADSLLTFLPEDSGIIASGALTADLNGSIRLSQMDMYNFGQADLSGKISTDGLIFKSPKDTIDIDIKGMTINVGPETIKSARSGREFKLLGVNGNITKAGISLKDALFVNTGNLNFAAKNSVNALSDKDSDRVYPLRGHLVAKELEVKDGGGLSLTLDETSNNFQMMPKRGNPKIPVLSLNSNNKRIFVRSDGNRAILTDAKIDLEAAMNSIERRAKFKAFMDSLAMAHPEMPRDSLRTLFRSRRQTQQMPEWMKEEDFKSGDLNFSLDGTMAKYFREWDIKGDVDVRTGIIMTQMLPLRNILKGMDMSFNNNEVKIENFKMMAGESEIVAKGALTGLRRALLGRGAYQLDMELSTEKMDAGELLAALNAGASVDKEASKAMAEGASDAEFLKMVVVDTLETTGISALLIVPADLNAELKVNAGNIKFSDLLINELDADIVMRERCMQIVNSTASTNMGQAQFEGFYATRSKKDIQTGFNLSMSDVTSEKVIAMMPSISEIMPPLKSFKGQLNCEIAATADLDTCMNITLPTVNGVIRLSGENLSITDDEMFSELAKTLRFKNRKQGKIDKMTVEGLIKNNTLEVFPFILDLDRYTIALSGIQNLDMSYKYHASIIRSPLIFKIGVDIFGPDFDNMKFKIGRPKYKNANVPAFTTVIDQTRLNLAESIRTIFEKGVEIAVRENEQQEAIEEHKKEIGYVNAAEQNIEEFSEEERRQLEEEQRKAEAPAQIDSASINETLNMIISKEI